MEVGVVGLGKLGLPVALAIESKGHNVVGYDINPDITQYVEDKWIPFKEKGIEPLLEKTNLEVVQSIGDVVARSDIVMIPIQTPHDPEYEGATRLPEDRKDFDYSYLIGGITEVAEEAKKQQKKIATVVISTCLPGTYEREIRPIIEDNEYVDYVYSPQFIAMGTVLDDYLQPEFNLIGVESETAADQLERFYTTINNAPNLRTDITTAEAIKVSYNTFITMKTVLANTWGELCHKVGANVDDVFKAWSLSKRRLLSPNYLKAGVGDGGGCHPRDNIALSHIAEELDLSHNLFEDLMEAREDHMAWLGNLGVEKAKERELPLVVLGRSFKPETNIETGSPAILMANIIAEELNYPVINVEDLDTYDQAVYIIGTKHERYAERKFAEGSVIIDPFGLIKDRPGIEVIRIGRKW